MAPIRKNSTAAGEKNTTASYSGKLGQVRSVWKSFKIQWANPGVKDLITTTRYPLVILPQVKNFDAKPYLNPNKYAPGENLNSPTPLPASEVLKTAHANGVVERFPMPPLAVPRVKPEAADGTYAAASDKGISNQKLEAVRMLMPSEGVMCTSLEQWVFVDIDLTNDPVDKPPIHLWAFLQPPRIGGNKNPLGQDQSLILDDCPRSGWSEIKIEPGANKAVCIQWDEGVSSWKPLESSEWDCSRLDNALRGAMCTYRYKIRVVVTNQKTDGDVSRDAKMENTKIPEKDFEAGCWLKVWVRDPNAGFTLSPKDDELDTVMNSMNKQSMLQTGNDYQGMTGSYSIGCHGFLRARMKNGTLTRNQDAAKPVYVLLFSKNAMNDLIALDVAMKAKGASGSQIMAATAGTTVAAILVGFGLRKLLDYWKNQKMTGPSEARCKNNPELLQQMNEEKGQFLIELLESYQIANHLAAYAADGFQHGSPGKALAAATLAKKTDLMTILSHLYGQVFDFCLVDSPTHYKNYATKRLESRQKFLEGQIQWSAAHTDRAKAQAISAGEQKASRQKENAAQLEKMGLGMATKAKESADKKKGKIPSKGLDLDKNQLGPVNLLEGNKLWSFPSPFGAPLPIPAVPMVWRVDIALHGDLSVTFNITPPPDDKGEWHFKVEFKGNGSLSIAAGIHALWSSMSDALPASDTKQKDLKGEFEQNKQDLRDLRKAALNGAASPKTEVVRLLHSLMKFASLDIAVNASLSVVSVTGFDFTYNHLTGEHSHQWTTIDKKPTNATAKVSMDAHLQFSVITLDYNLAGMPKLATANPELISLNFSGQVLGNAWDVEPLAYRWGTGDLKNTILRVEDSDFVVWGRPAKFELGYTDLKMPVIDYDLSRTSGKDPKSVCPILPAAIVNHQDGSSGTSMVTLQLSCQKTAPGGIVRAGGWVLGTAFKVLGGEHDTGMHTEAGKLIHDILHTPQAWLYLRGNFLGSMFSSTEKFWIPCPRIMEPVRAEWKAGQLQLHVSLGYFEDTHIWAQLVDEHQKPIPLATGGAWACLRINERKQGAKSITGYLLPALKDSSFRGHAFGVKLSLVPDDQGRLV